MSNARTLTQTSLWLALLIIGSQITIPFGPIPLTLQTLIVLVLGLCAPPLVAFLVPTAYMLLGLMGLPVFAGWVGGFDRIFAPTFGFVLAFSLVSPLMAAYLDKVRPQTPTLTQEIITLFLATLLIYVIGAGYFYWQQRLLAPDPMNIQAILQVAVWPFLIGDAFKAGIALMIARRLRPRLPVH